MSPTTSIEGQIKALKEARRRASELFNVTTNPVKREALQLICETMCYRIAHKEIELQNLLLTTHNGQETSDRQNFRREPL